MKKFLLIIFIVFGTKAFAQKTEKNGTIYKKHPYIDVVNNLAALYQKGDAAAMVKAYAANAQISGMSRYNNLAKTGHQSGAGTKSILQAKAGWQQIFDNWEQIKMKSLSNPDGLEYANAPFTVQSWWRITMVNKKTKKSASVEIVLFDIFNKDGKIATQLEYYDPTTIIAAMK